MRPVLQNLLTALETYPSQGASRVTELFCSLQLSDLGFYVSDASAMEYMRNRSYPITKDAFMLEHALHQSRFEERAAVAAADSSSSVSAAAAAPSAPAARGKFVPYQWKSSARDIIGCSTLFESPEATLCWFVLPPGGALPLHDHPRMSALQRVLFGRIAITAFEVSGPEGAAGLPATVKFNSVVEGAEGDITPDKLLSFAGGGAPGTLHELRNVDAAAPALFIDVLSPPYHREPDAANCTYYQAFTGAADAPVSDLVGAFKVGDTALLRPRAGYAGPDMDAFVRLG